MRLYNPVEGERRPVAALRWGVAGLLVAGLHMTAGWWLLSRSFATPPAQVQGIPIDLEPVAVPQKAPTPNAAPAAGPAPVSQAAAAPEPALPTEAPETPPPADATPPPPEPPPEVAEATPPAPPEPEPRLTEPQVTPPPEPSPVPPPQPVVKSDAVLATPPPPPKAPPRSDPRVLAREAAKRKALAETRERARIARQDARAAARAAQQQDSGGAPAPSAAPSSASSGADAANWRGAVVAHLNGFKPASNGASGTARVAFAVDRGGRVVSANLAGSSGDPALDAAAIAMVRRASPVPAPPADMGGRINLTVPVRFH